MTQFNWTSPWFRWMVGILCTFLLVDTLVLARQADQFRFPGEISEIELARRGAMTLVTRYRALAKQAEVAESPAVTEAIRSFEANVELAATPERVVDLVRDSSGIQRLIAREVERAQQQVILRVLNEDPSVKASGTSPTLLLITGEDGFGPVVLGAEPLLQSATLEALRSHPRLRYFTQVLQMEVSRGQATILTPTDQLARIELLRLEIESLNHSINETKKFAGFTALSGQGIIVKASDRPGGYLWAEIVHEQDIREIVNLLYAAGALGIEIGGQRVVANSWIRCVGPVVIVNARTVAANPVLIRAVGSDPRKMEAALTSLQRQFARTGKRLAAEVRDQMTLSAYQGKVAGWSGGFR